MSRYKINKILKISQTYEKQVSNFKKEAYWQLVLAAIPFIGMGIDYLQSTKNIIDDVNELSSVYNSYVNKYSKEEKFQEKKDTIDKFIETCQALQKTHIEALKITKPSGKDAKILHDFLQFGQAVIDSGPSIIQDFKDLRTTAGKIWEVISFIGYNLGIDTATTNIIQAIEQLIKHVSEAFPEIQSQYQKALDAKAQSPDSTSTELSTSKESPAPSTPSSTSTTQEAISNVSISPALQKELESLA